jgi:glycosyltransferase involved in cell wall biosynthesis
VAAEAARVAVKSVLVNAVSVKEGGSAIVLRRLLDEMSLLAPAVEWHVVADQSLVDSWKGHRQISAYAFPWIRASALHLSYWYEFELPRLVDRLRPDVLYSQTNYLPLRRLASPSLLLVQHAGHFSDEFARMTLATASPLGKLAWHAKRKWVHASLSRATRVTVQTQALADNITRMTGMSGDGISVIPHGPGLIQHPLPPKTYPIRRPIRIGYITKFGVQKNFAALLRAINHMREAGHDIKLVLTLDHSNSSDGFGAIQALVDELGIGHVMENLGDLPPDRIQQVYAGLDAFVFPSTVESFGFPMVEAMASGLPLLVAETPTNLEVTGGAAGVFSAYDDAALARLLDGVIRDRKVYDDLAVRSAERAKDFSWRRSALQTLDALEQVSTG